jgi:hypothetical protein
MVVRHGPSNRCPFHHTALVRHFVMALDVFCPLGKPTSKLDYYPDGGVVIATWYRNPDQLPHRGSCLTDSDWVGGYEVGRRRRLDFTCRGVRIWHVPLSLCLVPIREGKDT